MKPASFKGAMLLACGVAFASCGGRSRADVTTVVDDGGRGPNGDDEGRVPASGTSGGGGRGSGVAGETSDAGSAGETVVANAGRAGDGAGGGGVEGGEGGVGGSPIAGAGGADGDGTSLLPVSCRAVPAGRPDGDYLVDPNGGDASDAFTVTCDLTTDGGGWTLIGRGQWWKGDSDALPAGSDAYLTAAKRSAIVGLSTSLFRAGEGAQRLFIKDASALLESWLSLLENAGIERCVRGGLRRRGRRGDGKHSLDRNLVRFLGRRVAYLRHVERLDSLAPERPVRRLRRAPLLTRLR